MKKIKFQINRPEPTSKEINSMMNFDSVLSGAKLAAKPWYTKASWLKGIGGGIALVSIVTLTILFFDKNSEQQNSKQNETTESGSVISQPAKTEPAVESISPSEIKVDHPNRLNDPKSETAVISYASKQKRKKDQGGRFEENTVIAEKGGKIVTKQKSWLNIPAGIFRNKNNQKVVGKVKIFTREFHDALDIALSDIPMEYDSTGATHLQSAGMIEIWAVQNGDTLSMEKGKGIKVNLTSTIESKSYNLYYLNPANDKWDYLGKDSVWQASSSASLKKSNVSMVEEPSGRLTQENNVEIPVLPRKKDNKRYRFNIDIDPKEFPELAEFNGIFFEVEPGDSNFTASFYKIAWNDIALSNSNEKNCIATFSQKISLLDAFPYISHDKELYKSDPVYRRMVDNRQGDKLVSSFRVFPVYDNVDSAKVWKLYNQKLDQRKKKEEEIREAREKAANELSKNKSAVARTNENIYRTFTAMNMGVYNCDQIYRLAKRTTRRVYLVASDGMPIGIFDYVKVVDKSQNSVFSYYTNDITYNPNSENLLLVTRTNGNIAYVEPSRFKEFSDSRSTKDLEVREQEANFVDVAAMKKFLSELK